MCKNVVFSPERSSLLSFVTFPYIITKFTKDELDGSIPNNRFRGVVKTREAFEKTIDDALTGNFVNSASHVTMGFPENINNLTSPPSFPDPIPASGPLAFILPPRIDRVPTNEVPSVWSTFPAPIPAPQLQLLAVMFPFNIVRFHTVELNPKPPSPLPIPAP
jgi:hypothetical protein